MDRRLQPRRVVPRCPFALPGGPLVPALATTAILWLLSHATGREVALEVVVLGMASAYYLAMLRGLRA